MLALAFLTVLAGPPPQEVSRFDSQRVGYTVTQTPGTAHAGETFELAIVLEELVKNQDPSFGHRRLLAGASVEVFLLAPNGTPSDARLAVREGDDGHFVAHFTPPADGIYSAHLRGSAPDGITLDYAVLVAVNVWPMLAGLSPDPLPVRLPVPTIGDARHGKAICAHGCTRPPQRMTSEAAEALVDAALLDDVAPVTQTARSVDRFDVLAYVRSQFIRVRDLFPKAVAYVPEACTLDTDAVARLQQRGAQATNGTVFVVYGGDASKRVARIEPTDRRAKSALVLADRLGYVVYDTSGLAEVAVGLSRGLNVVSARSRDSDGTMRDLRLGHDAPEVRRAIELVSTLLVVERQDASIEADLK